VALKQSGPGSCGCSCWGTDCIPPTGVAFPGSGPSGSGTGDCCLVPDGTFLIGSGDAYYSDATDYTLPDCKRCKWIWRATANHYAMRQLGSGFTPSYTYAPCRYTFTGANASQNDVFAECEVFGLPYSSLYSSGDKYVLFGMHAFYDFSYKPAALTGYPVTVSLELLQGPTRVRVQVRREYMVSQLRAVYTTCGTIGCPRWCESGFGYGGPETEGSDGDLPLPYVMNWACGYTIDEYLYSVSDCKAVPSSIPWTSRTSYYEKYEHNGTTLTTTTGSTDSFTINQYSGKSYAFSKTITFCPPIDPIELVF